MVQPLWKMVWQFLTKLNIFLPYNPAPGLVGIYPNELKTCPEKNLHTDVHNSCIRNCQNLDAIKISFRDFSGGPVVKTSPSNAGGTCLIPCRGAKIPHASGPKNQNIKQKQYCNKFNKDLKKKKISFSRQMDKPWYAHTMEYDSALKQNMLSSHEKTRSKLKCILLNERRQSEKVILYDSNYMTF